ncbi:MAG: hypothetical protein ACP5XB_27825 [Isosphaeraceae bacterium]
MSHLSSLRTLGIGVVAKAPAIGTSWQFSCGCGRVWVSFYVDSGQPVTP